MEQEQIDKINNSLKAYIISDESCTSYGRVEATTTDVALAMCRSTVAKLYVVHDVLLLLLLLLLLLVRRT